MNDRQPLIIAHRGASGYLPEHTLEAKALAVGLGADYLEQDVVATRDNELVVLHDIHLERVTNAATLFPGRQRPDGRFYARDFDLAELKELRLHERSRPGGGAVYPQRFPPGTGRFRIATLREEIELIQGLERSMQKTIGLYPEIKRPAWHREEGIDLAKALLDVLDEYGYCGRSCPVYIQCFDAGALRRVRRELACDLKLIQLIATDGSDEAGADLPDLLTPAGLERLAETVDGIGPSTRHCYALADGRPRPTDLVSDAHARGLAVHPYTFRADDVAPGFASFGKAVRWFVNELAIDGLFTDFPDLARGAIEVSRPGD